MMSLFNKQDITVALACTVLGGLFLGAPWANQTPNPNQQGRVYVELDETIYRETSSHTYSDVTLTNVDDVLTFTHTCATPTSQTKKEYRAHGIESVLGASKQVKIPVDCFHSNSSQLEIRVEDYAHPESLVDISYKEY